MATGGFLAVLAFFVCGGVQLMVNVSSDSNVEAGDIFSLRYLTYRPLMKPSCPLLMPSRRDATSRCQTSQDMTTLPSCQETALVYFAAQLYVTHRFVQSLMDIKLLGMQQVLRLKTSSNAQLVTILSFDG